MNDAKLGDKIAKDLISKGVPEREAYRVACSVILGALVDAGMELPTAYDHVFGSGAYKQLADEIWTELNA
jgi:hypothetical protein